jgi:hypothetical protein
MMPTHEVALPSMGGDAGTVDAVIGPARAARVGTFSDSLDPRTSRFPLYNGAALVSQNGSAARALWKGSESPEREGSFDTRTF